MLNKIARYILVTIAALALVFFGFNLAPKPRNVDAEFSYCRNTPTPTCLIDWGLEKAMASKTLPRYTKAVTWLAQMGRIEGAYALEIRIEEGKAPAPDKARKTADRRLASHRLAAEIRSGESLEDAIQNTPGVDPGVLWITALELLGRHPYGPERRPVPPPDENTRRVIAKLAQKIETLAQKEADRPRTSHLVYAANLYAALGDPAAALRALQGIPKSEEVHLLLDADLIRAVGVDNAMKIYRETPGRSTHTLLFAASAEEDPAKAKSFLEEAFAVFAAQPKWPDFNNMTRTVQKAAKLGDQDLSLKLARDMANLAETTQYPFQVFGNIYAAKSLSAARAPAEEIRESIDFALSLFPEDPSKVMGYGLVSGPIRWKNSGLEAEARQDIANLLARIGDLEKAEQLMDGLENPALSWNAMLTPDISVEYYDPLLHTASQVLSTAELAYVRALFAAEILRSDETEAQREWALRTAKEIADQGQIEGKWAMLAYYPVLLSAADDNDPDLRDKALGRMVDVAIASGKYSDLIKAGFEWHMRNPD